MEIAQTTKMEENQRRSVHFKTDPKVTPNRSTWFGKLDFVMSALSFAIGLGNLWRFPYMCYRNGGGAFLVPFLVMTLVAGFPLIFLECYFGQYGRVGIVTIWKVAPLFQGIGWTLLVSGWACAIYYNVLIAYAVFYLFASFVSQVPWKTCGNSWNTANCARIECARNNNKSFGVACPDKGNFTQDVHSPADEFFHHRMLGLSSGLTELGNVRVELAACLFLCWFIILISLSKGIESSGKVAYITASLPYFVLIAIFFRAITLEGATNGLLYFITPVWDRVIKPRVWGDAAIQVFYSMSICDGGLITLASYNRFHNNCFTDAVIIAVGDCLTSVLCGAVIFAVLGYMAHDMDVTVDSVVSQGAGLAYVVYPSAVANLPMSSFWAVIFMLMVINLGLGTMFGIVTTTHTTIMDVFPTTLRQGRLSFLLLASICFVTWLMGLICTTDGGMYVLQLMDAYSSSYILLLVGVIEPIVLCWIYGRSLRLTL
ncbi:Sodium- and chloride-dependent glycine transporter 2 [Lamellibrachia satsuma]|nr:Sodium- and chloride-dependent glycine transporter 2 [Lamellibrachia satsuma]